MNLVSTSDIPDQTIPDSDTSKTAMSQVIIQYTRSRVNLPMDESFAPYQTLIPVEHP